MEKRISIEGLNKADVLSALYNASKPQCMGFMHYDPTPMTGKEAQAILDSGETCFNYLKGRVMKVDLSRDDFDPYAYDRDNGQNAVEFAITALRATNNLNSPIVRGLHRVNTHESAERTRQHMRQHMETKSSYEQLDHGATSYFGLVRVADVLGRKVDESIKRLDELKD